MEWTNVRSLRLTGFIRLRFVFPNADPCRSLQMMMRTMMNIWLVWPLVETATVRIRFVKGDVFKDRGFSKNAKKHHLLTQGEFSATAVHISGSKRPRQIRNSTEQFWLVYSKFTSQTVYLDVHLPNPVMLWWTRPVSWTLFFFVGKFWAQPLWWNWYFRALRKDICKNHLELIYFHVLGMYSWKELSSHKGGRNDIAEMMLLFIGGILHLSQFSCPILLNWFVWKEGFRIVDAFPAHKHLFFSFHFHSQPPSNLPKESSTW